MFANPVGEANDARKKTATFAAAFMGSAKMELAFVSADGTAFTVPWRAVAKAVEATEAARPTSKENGAATVIRVGKDPIVAFGSRPVVTMVMMMTKVSKYWKSGIFLARFCHFDSHLAISGTFRRLLAIWALLGEWSCHCHQSWKRPDLASICECTTI